MPPSEPRSSSRASFSHLEASGERPARLQMIVALVLGLVLIAIPLYLWRRPRAPAIAAIANDAGAGALTASPTSTVATPESKVTLGVPKLLSCHDPGPKKTAPEDCDHLPDVEKAFVKAIEENAACVPSDAGGGSVVYLADVSFKRRGITVSTPKEGRTLKSSKVVSACQAAVRAKLHGLSLDETTNHAHARYRISLTATYP